MAKKKICKIRLCKNEIYRFNLCEEHYHEEEEEQKLNDKALTLLRKGLVDNKPLTKNNLKEEFSKLSNYWSDTCLTARTRTQIGCIPVSQFEATTSWCKNIAKIIIEEEISYRNGEENYFPSTGFMKQDLWARFAKLEKELIK